MLTKLSAGLAALLLLSGSAFAQGAAKPSDPQIAHIAYTAGVLDIEAGKQAWRNPRTRTFAPLPKTWCAITRR